MHAAPLLLAALGALHDCCAPQAYSDASTDTCGDAAQKCIQGMCMSACSKNDDCTSTPARPGYGGTPLCLGGYCAFAASKGYLAPTIADAWTIHEDRLYLNFNLRAQELWRADIPGNIAKGLANWPGILG